jgi:hypothetical protein
MPERGERTGQQGEHVVTLELPRDLSAHLDAISAPANTPVTGMPVTQPTAA